MKILFVRLRTAGLLGLALAIGLTLAYWLRPGALDTLAPARQLPIYSVEREFPIASLTFDAAWGDEDTQQLIDILARYDVRATFFVVGDWARKYPESVAALAGAGHEIMNHSNRHDHMTRLSAEQIKADLLAANEAIAAASGSMPALFRAPYGEYDDKVILAVRAAGMETVQWDVDSLDWRDLSAADIQKRVLARVGPGSIVLFHNAAKHTPAALPGIIESLQRDGYRLVKVSELLHPGEYTLDHTGRQFPVRPMR